MQLGSGLMVILFSLGLAGKMKIIKDNLKEKERGLRSIFESTNEGFWEIDNDGITINVNPEMCRMLHATEGEVAGVSIYNFLDQENTLLFDNQKSLRDSGKADSYELAYRRLDGSLVNCLVNATPRFDKSGKKSGAFAMVTDISSRIETEKKFNNRIKIFRRQMRNWWRQMKNLKPPMRRLRK